MTSEALADSPDATLNASKDVCDIKADGDQELLNFSSRETASKNASMQSSICTKSSYRRVRAIPKCNGRAKGCHITHVLLTPRDLNDMM